MGKRSEVTASQRRDAVLALLRREEPAAALSEPTLYRWRDEFLSAGEAALALGPPRGPILRPGRRSL